MQPGQSSTKAAKQTLRQALLQKRDAMEPAERQQASAAICRHLALWLKDRRPKLKQVLAFMPHRSEPDLLALPGMLSELLFGWPVVDSLTSRTMTFYGWRSGDPLVTGAFGIQEPDPQLQVRLELTPETVILVPALAVDKQGHRLGYGGGFYDRFLSQEVIQRNKLTTIAVCFDAFANDLLQDKIPVEPHDLRLHFVATEAGVTSLSESTS